mmetsp:Transcript_9750/g.28720  ORF Transcript_9750/g.28720 Transcript_9750/m.28720 type:complete len:252 (-) Transcript_9750:102-857(-)
MLRRLELAQHRHGRVHVEGRQAVDAQLEEGHDEEVGPELPQQPRHDLRVREELDEPPAVAVQLHVRLRGFDRVLVGVGRVQLERERAHVLEGRRRPSMRRRARRVRDRFHPQIAVVQPGDEVARDLVPVLLSFKPPLGPQDLLRRLHEALRAREGLPDRRRDGYALVRPPGVRLHVLPVLLALQDARPVRRREQAPPVGPLVDGAAPRRVVEVRSGEALRLAVEPAAERVGQASHRCLVAARHRDGCPPSR